MQACLLQMLGEWISRLAIFLSLFLSSTHPFSLSLSPQPFKQETESITEVKKKEKIQIHVFKEASETASKIHVPNPQTIARNLTIDSSIPIYKNKTKHKTCIFNQERINDTLLHHDSSFPPMMQFEEILFSCYSVLFITLFA